MTEPVIFALGNISASGIWIDDVTIVMIWHVKHQNVLFLNILTGAVDAGVSIAVTFSNICVCKLTKQYL